MNIALKQLREGLKWADAEIDPEWYGMGDAAHAAMRKFPPFVEWRKENPEEDIDSKALELARTPEFEKFLVEMFPEEEIPVPADAEDKQLSVLKDILKELKRMNELKALELGINHPVAEELRQIMA